jgi:hypothetical protein
MLDSVPAAPLNAGVPAQSAAAPIRPDSALQMNVGIHTDAFGNVEIHTVVAQSQVAVAFHGNSNLARWFSCEVSGLEAGLKSQNLNLAAVDFAGNRSAVQTATSFQHGQPRQPFSQNPDHGALALAEAAAPQPQPESDLAVALPLVPLPETRVSILV